uniref:Uncharacterized protein n=1 Tax=Oryza sativa subsp. japonica TaxID=39947 RepID=Q5Z573_ORYSJ|nr:hypothetical protein [Oryza sativa Japonica Group]
MPWRWPKAGTSSSEPWHGGGWRGEDAAARGLLEPRPSGRGSFPLPPRPATSSTILPSDLEEGERGSALDWLRLAAGGFLRALL